jgi:hypothetical protein
MKKIIVFMACLILYPSLAFSATYYARNDGGDATQCTGLADAAYPGSGTGQACAFRSPATALKYNAVILQGGDTLIIDNVDRLVGSGQAKYKVMYGGNDITGNNCSVNAQPNCVMAAFPSGTAQNPTKIYGKNHASCDDLAVASKAELWGGGRQFYTVNAESDYVEIKCLAITDHDQCAEVAPYGGAETWQCANDGGAGNFTGARWGLSLNGADNVLLENVDVYGQSVSNINAGSSSNLTFRKSRFMAAGSGGIDYDNPFQPTDTLTGSFLYDRVKIMYAGCTQKYPLVNADIQSTDNLYKCNSQSQCAGYGDAVPFGEGAGGGNHTFIDSDVSFNVQDGFDFLHAPSANLTIKRSRFEGNAGNPIKLPNGVNLVENSKIIGNCGWFNDKSFKSTVNCIGGAAGFDSCRAAGNTLEINTGSASSTRLYNNTIYSNGDLMINNSNQSSIGTLFEIENNILFHAREWNDVSASQDAGFYNCCSAATGTCNCSGSQPTSNFNVVYNRYNTGFAPSGTGNVTGDPLINEAVDVEGGFYYGLEMDVTLASTSSSAYNIADETTPLTEDVDFNNWARGANWDAGAYEEDTEGGGSTCDSSCPSCSDQTTCEASSATCYWWSDSSCRASAEPDCDSNCDICADQTECEASANPCYWWSTNVCEASVEPDDCNDDCSLCGNQSTCEASTVPCDWSSESIKEDFTTYTETDPGNDITLSTFSVAVDTMQRGVFSNVRKSYGQNFFGDFVQKGEVIISARTDGQIIGIWAVNNGATTIDAMNETGSPGYVLSYGTDGGSFGFYLEYFGPSDYDFDQFVETTAMPFTRYWTATRSAATMTVAFYSDSARTTLLDTISVTGDSTLLEYVYAVINRGLTGTQSGSLTTSNLILNETNQCVTESADTCDDDCTICLSQQGCEGSTQTCYWWSDNTCKTTQEIPDPPTPGTGAGIEGGGITGGGISFLDQEPMGATIFSRKLKQCYEDAEGENPCVVIHRDYGQKFALLSESHIRKLIR